MKFKEYEMPDGRKAVFEYDENGVGKITLECMDMLMEFINDRKTENSSEKPNKSTISKMEQVDKDTNVRSKAVYDKWGNVFDARADIDDEPQTERSE